MVLGELHHQHRHNIPLTGVDEKDESALPSMSSGLPPQLSLENPLQLLIKDTSNTVIEVQ